jgi:flagellar biosynthetic protein FliO
METIQQMLAMCLVLVLLGGALWWLRRRGLAQFSHPGFGKSERKMRVVEKLPLSPGHSLHLVRVGDRMLLVASSPGGCALLEALPGDGLPQGQEPVR